MLWKDIYADKDISLLVRIDQGRYLVETRGSAVILPSVWDAIVRPGMTLDIRFPEDHSELDGRYARSPSLRTQSTAKRHQIDNEYDVYEFFAVRGTFSFAVTATFRSGAATFPCSVATFPSSAATSPFGTAILSSATTTQEPDCSSDLLSVNLSSQEASDIEGDYPPAESGDPSSIRPSFTPPVDAKGKQLSIYVDTINLQKTTASSKAAGIQENKTKAKLSEIVDARTTCEKYQITRIGIKEAR